MRLLIVSTLDSKEPFGAFTRPFYLGKYLSKYFEVCQLGLDCSSVDYAESVSVGTRSLRAYRQAIHECVASFQPDIVYAQETLPAIAALFSVGLRRTKRPSLVFDFHTLSAFEYWTRLSSSPHRIQEFKQFIKTYIAQGILIFSGKPIIAAGQTVVNLIQKWYPIRRIEPYALGNGVPDDLLNCLSTSEPDPYSHLRPAKVVVVIAPKTFSFPTNDMSVDLTIQIAKYLEDHKQHIRFVIIGRESDGLEYSLPANVSFTGFLPERKDFLASLHYADIALLPFSRKAVAGGARNKALDYFASQKLVISTPEGLRGLDDFQHEKHLLITGYTAEEIANTVFKVCESPESYQPLVEAAFSLIQAKYSWGAMAEKVANYMKNYI